MKVAFRILTLAVVCSLASFTGCTGDSSGGNTVSASTKKRIVLLNNTESPFWDAARAGIAKAAEDFKIEEAGFTAGLDSNSKEEAGQLEMLRQYGTQSDVAAVIISPISDSNAAIAAELRNLAKKGIIVGCFDSDLSEQNHKYREFYIGTDNLEGGRVLGTTAKNLRPGGGSYAQFVGMDSQQNARDRMDGFTQAVGDEYKQLDRRLDDVDPKKARDNVRDMIDRFSELNILVGIWSYNAPAIVDVVKEKGLREKFTVVTFDAEPAAIQQMDNGMIDAMVVQNPYRMGYDSVKYAFAKLTGDDKTVAEMFPDGKDVLNTGLKVVIPDSNTPLTAEMFAEFGDGLEVQTLSEFKAWLAENDLKGS